MGVTLSTAARNAAADAVVDLLDAGASPETAGDIAFATSADSVKATCVMSKPAFGSASTGVCTASAIAAGTVSGASTSPQTVITKAFFRNMADTEIFRCVVASPSGGDINLSSNIVNNDDTITITSLTYTQPAS